MLVKEFHIQVPELVSPLIDIPVHNILVKLVYRQLYILHHLCVYFTLGVHSFRYVVDILQFFSAEVIVINFRSGHFHSHLTQVFLVLLKLSSVNEHCLASQIVLNFNHEGRVTQRIPGDLVLLELLTVRLLLKVQKTQSHIDLGTEDLVLAKLFELLLERGQDLLVL